ncbi:hypothetical protein ACOME3_005649 [Neoechinorhynchus agilis]
MSFQRVLILAVLTGCLITIQCHEMLNNAAGFDDITVPSNTTATTTASTVETSTTTATTTASTVETSTTTATTTASTVETPTTTATTTASTVETPTTTATTTASTTSNGSIRVSALNGILAFISTAVVYSRLF